MKIDDLTREELLAYVKKHCWRISEADLYFARWEVLEDKAGQALDASCKIDRADPDRWAKTDALFKRFECFEKKAQKAYDEYQRLVGARKLEG